MSETAHVPPDDLVHDLAMSLWRDRAMLRDLARRKAWEPSIDDCRRIAEQQVEQLKRHGVVEVRRRIAPAHSMRPESAPVAPSGLPVWRSHITGEYAVTTSGRLPSFAIRLPPYLLAGRSRRLGIRLGRGVLACARRC